MDSDAEHVRLYELDETEWRDVARRVRPDINDEEFAAMWADFQERKAAGQLTPPN